MMPPKKSQAARKLDTSSTEDAPPTNDTPKDEVDDDQEEVNIFRVEMVGGKRARNQPAGDQEWLDEHLEEKEDQHVNSVDAYENYVSASVAKGTFAIAQHEFTKAMKLKFPKGCVVKENSPYAGLIRVKKPKKEKKTSKVQADTFKLKLKDIVMRGFDELGNPDNGLRFHTIKQHLAGKYPALRLDMRPKVLLHYLERSVSYGHIEQTKGIGICGYFRKPGPLKGKEDKENKKKEKKAKDNDVDVKEEGDPADDTDEKEEKTDEGEKAKDAGEKKQEGDDSEKEEKNDEKKDAKKKKKNDASKKKKKTVSKVYRSFVVHSDPERIEDAFEMAMTFMVEPKEASIGRIMKYLETYYVDDLGTERMRKCLENGIDKGFWDQVTGQGMSGRLRLMMDEFDPTADDDLIGQVMNAIVALSEPKQCSANLLKRYLLEYHPEFKIAEKPFLFKKSLERALKKDLILQLSGIGCSGSFQLSRPFTPTPVILRGEDSEDDYESESEDETPRSVKVKDEGQGHGQFHISTFKDAYQPRPSKRKGHGRDASKGISDEPAANKVKKTGRFRATVARQEVKPAKPSKKKRPTYKEESESDDEPPKKQSKKQSTSRGSKQGSGARSPVKSYKEDSEEESEDEKPKKKSATPKRPAKKSNVKESSDEEDEDAEVLPQKKDRSRTPAKRTAPAPKSKSKAAKKKPQTPVKKSTKKPVEDSEDEDVGAKVTPRSRSRGASNVSSGRQTPRKEAPRGKYTEVDSSADEKDSEDSEKEEEEKVTPPPKKRGGANEKDSEDSEKEEEEKVTPPPKKRGGSTPSTATTKKSASKPKSKRKRRR